MSSPRTKKALPVYNFFADTKSTNNIPEQNANLLFGNTTQFNIQMKNRT